MAIPLGDHGARERHAGQGQRLSRDAERRAAFDRSLDRLALSPAAAPLTRRAILLPDQAGEGWVALKGLAAISGVFVSPQYLVPYAAHRGYDRSAVLLAGLMGLGALTGSALLLWALSWAQNRTRLGGVFARNRLLYVTVDAVLACDRAYRAPDDGRARRLRAVDRRYRRLEECLLRAHRTRRTMARSSPRRAPARQHAALVAGALRRDMARIDVEPDRAVAALAERLVRISERYAEGRIGALLSEEELAGVEPLSVARKVFWESAHMLLVVACALGGALTAHRWGPDLHVPGDAEPFLAVAGFLVGGTLAGGWRRALQLKEALSAI